jgi:serine/threonine protein phosphatase PrpC
MIVSAFAFSDIGKHRTNNEDAYRLGSIVSKASSYEESFVDFDLGAKDIDPILTFVCDGVGGRAAGEVASGYVTSAFDSVSALSNDAVIRRLNEVNYGLYTLMDRTTNHQGMGCTIAGMLLSPTGLLAFSIGDSTVFEFTGRYLRPLTQLHTSTGDYDGKLTRAMGCYPIPLIMEPSFHRIILEPGLFLIATDGVIRNLDEDALAADFNQSKNPMEMGHNLRDMVLNTEARDNFTAILLDVHK